MEGYLDRFERTDAQRRMHAFFCQCLDSERREALVSMPRKAGKTQGLCMFAAGLLECMPDTKVVLVGSCKRVSNEMRKRIKTLRPDGDDAANLHFLSYNALCAVHDVVKGDCVFMMDEAAYLDPTMWKDCIFENKKARFLFVSTLTSELNFYTRLFNRPELKESILQLSP